MLRNTISGGLNRFPGPEISTSVETQAPEENKAAKEDIPLLLVITPATSI
jgi:hypothetical protein